MTTIMSSLLISRLAEHSAFKADARFDLFSAPADQEETCATPERDPAEIAFEHGFAEGKAAAEAEWLSIIAQREKEFAKLVGALEMLQRSEADGLAERFHQIVLMLCESAVLPLAIDVEGLARRCRSAAGMLRREWDEKIIKLHPDDALLVAPILSPDLNVEADPTVERGGLRIDPEDGGVEDGPAIWRQRLVEAIGEC